MTLSAAKMRGRAFSRIAELARKSGTRRVKDWHSRNAALVQHRNGRRLPSRPHEYMLYQALVGAWPDKTDVQLVARMQRYAVKAAREGKEETNWTDPNEAYETALREFVAGVLDPTISAGFLASFEEFAARTTLLGALNSLSQLVLKSRLPGVPDFYKGTEFWNLSLVDPDNRRSVDFSERRSFLAESPLPGTLRRTMAGRSNQACRHARAAGFAARPAQSLPARNLRADRGHRAARSPRHCLCADLKEAARGGRQPAFRTFHRTDVVGRRAGRQDIALAPGKYRDIFGRPQVTETKSPSQISSGPSPSVWCNSLEIREHSLPELSQLSWR